MANSPPPASPTYSLRGRLLWLLLIAVALAALLQGAIGYSAAGSEADEIFDYHMQQIALALRGGLLPPSLPPRPEEDGDGPNFDFVIQIWAADGTPVFASTNRAELPRQAVQGFSDVTVSGTQYRVYSMVTPTRVIQVGRSEERRVGR